MKPQGPDLKRRRLLTGAAGVVGGVGVAYAAVPFLTYWQPSVQAEAAGAPVEVDISKLEPGQKIDVDWRGKPIWIFRRTPKELENLSELNNLLRDPHSEVATQQPPYCQNLPRSIRPEYGVIIGICTHLGCIPLYEPQPGSVDNAWPGGFFCPCHGSKYDLAGRVYKGVPAPLNLAIPPYWYPSESRIIIGEHQEEGAAS